jgi:lipopolysaccharide/colanic/teichoic acid biosynthesis glycosyltransferase
MLILGASIAVLQKGLTLTQPKYEIHAQHRASGVDRRAGHDPGISGHVRPESLVTLLRNTHEKVKLDVDYLQRQSLWFDIRILWLTFVKILRRDGVSH